MKSLTVSGRSLSRLASVPVLAAVVVVLGLAAWLEPAAGGHGTHTQLGLDGCTILSMTGWPCPMCGMTTTFSLLAHGRVPEAAWNQPFGVVLFLGVLAVGGVALAELVAPSDRWRRLWRWVLRREGRLTALFLLGLAAGWIWKIALMRGWMP